MNAVPILQTGRTALTLALQEGESEVAEVLIKAGAGLSHQENVFILHYVIMCVYPIFKLCRPLAGPHFSLQRRRATSLL